MPDIIPATGNNPAPQPKDSEPEVPVTVKNDDRIFLKAGYGTSEDNDGTIGHHGRFGASVGIDTTVNDRSLELHFTNEASFYLDHDASNVRAGLRSGIGGFLMLGIAADIGPTFHYNFSKEGTDALEPGLTGRIVGILPVGGDIGLFLGLEAGVLDLKSATAIEGSITSTFFLLGSF